MLHSSSYKFHTYLEETVDLYTFTETIQSQLLLMLKSMYNSDDLRKWEHMINSRAPRQKRGETSRKRDRPASPENHGDSSVQHGRPDLAQTLGEWSRQRGRPALPRTIRGTLLNYV